LRDGSLQDGRGRPRWLVGVLLTGTVAVLFMIVVAAAASAWASWGRPFPHLFLDPYGAYSNVGWFGWKMQELGIQYPDRLVAVDGIPLDLKDPLRARQAAEHFARLWAEGRREVRLTFATPSGPKDVWRTLHTIGLSEIVFFFGLYALAALFLLWTGLAVLRFAGRRYGARAYAVWTFHACAMMVTFFDYHTSQWLWPVFSVAAVGLNVCFLWMAYAFPEPPRRWRGLLHRLLIVVTGLAVPAALWLAVAPALGGDTVTLRAAVNQGFAISMVVLVLAMALRVKGARGRSRAELSSAFWGLALVPAVLALGWALLLAMGHQTIHFIFPFAFPLIPAAIGLAMVRHNILGTDAVLSRGLVIVPILVSSCATWLLSWLVLRWMARIDLDPWIPVLLSAPTPVLTAVELRRLSRRVFSPAADHYRLVLEALSDHLATQRAPEAIRRSIEHAVTRWLPTESARVISLEDVLLVARAPADALGRLTQGESIWTEDSPWQRSLLVPLRSLGEVRGVLLLGPKHQAALYTTADLHLLTAIASLGAVALHHAQVLGEVESLRRREVEATRDEKRFALGMVGAEISHEVTYSLNFFRYLLKRSGNGKSLDPKDVEIGREEVARLERMLAALRKLKPPSPVIRPVRLTGLLTRALGLIRESLEEKEIHASVDVPPELLLPADPDLALQLFANLFRNAAQAVSPGGSLGARWVPVADGARIEVWDNGPGIPDSQVGSIWNPWVTTRPDGTGLGLTISQRLARSLGWSLQLEQRPGQTCFVLFIPEAAMSQGGPRSGRGRSSSGGGGGGLG
jgi:signal transduction histidine kinase